MHEAKMNKICYFEIETKYKPLGTSNILAAFLYPHFFSRTIFTASTILLLLQLFRFFGDLRFGDLRFVRGFVIYNIIPLNSVHLLIIIIWYLI